MILKDYIVLLIAPSGTGKDTITNRLCEKYGYSRIKSYTTRPKREEDPKEDLSHIFITEKEFFDIGDKVAFGYFNNHYYCATSEQVDNNDIYIIDVEGLKNLRNLYDGEKKFIVIGLSAPEKTRYKRMIQRGDKRKKAKERIKYDRIAFKDYLSYLDMVFMNDEVEECVDDIHLYIQDIIKENKESRE